MRMAVRARLADRGRWCWSSASSAPATSSAPVLRAAPRWLVLVLLVLLVLLGGDDGGCGDELGRRWRSENLLGGESFAPRHVGHLFRRQQRVDVDD